MTSANAGVVLSTTTGGSIALTLPSAVSISGLMFTVKNLNGSNAIVITPVSAQTVDGAATYTVPATNNAYVQIVSDGSNWQVIDASAIASGSGVSFGKIFSASVNGLGV